jgi:XTP/dITP diphosphohydrolase
LRPLPARIVIATGNRGKLAEIRKLLAGLGVEVVAQSDLGVEAAEETGSTFAENALIKARHAAAVTGLPAIADDSGLEVDALGGRPGVHSARYAGARADDDRNIDKLLGELEGVADRGAAFRCVACIVVPGDPEPVIAAGEWRGSILHERRGRSGFGYDPVFEDGELGKSAAEMSSDEKNARSHRGKALKRLLQLIADR